MRSSCTVFPAAAGLRSAIHSDPESEHAELVWAFRELALRHGGWPVFYQVTPRPAPVMHRPRADPAEARRGGARAARHILARRREPARAATDISTMWSAAERRSRSSRPSASRRSCRHSRRSPTSGSPRKRTREKGFSLGFFDADYLANFPIALARREGEIVAFANVWTSEAKHTASVDLMRFSQEAPRGVMEYLFVNLILWARAEGYEKFDLGMAPLSGFERRALAPAWQRLGATGVPPRRALLPLPRAAPVQGEVRPGVGATLSRGAGWPGHAADSGERDGARIGRLGRCGE